MGPDRITVRAARDQDLPAVMTVLDAAMLEVDAADVRRRIDEGTVLVAVAADRVLGACVVDRSDGEPVHVDALAVRPGRRGQGIGSSLVRAAAARWGAIAADFDAGLRPFYESLGFEVVADGCRYRGVLRVDQSAGR